MVVATCVECLVLRGGRHLAVDRQICARRLDFALSIPQVLPRAHVIEMDVPLDPVNVAPLRMDRVMAQPHRVAHLFEQPRSWSSLSPWRGGRLAGWLAGLAGSCFCLSIGSFVFCSCEFFSP